MEDKYIDILERITKKAKELFECLSDWERKILIDIFNSDEPEAFYTKGVFYKYGINTEQDFNKAFHNFEMGWKNKNINCIEELSTFYKLGMGVEENHELSESLNIELNVRGGTLRSYRVNEESEEFLNSVFCKNKKYWKSELYREFRFCITIANFYSLDENIIINLFEHFIFTENLNIEDEVNDVISKKINDFFAFYIEEESTLSEYIKPSIENYYKLLSYFGQIYFSTRNDSPKTVFQKRKKILFDLFGITTKSLLNSNEFGSKYSIFLNKKIRWFFKENSTNLSFFEKDINEFQISSFSVNEYEIIETQRKFIDFQSFFELKKIFMHAIKTINEDELMNFSLLYFNQKNKKKDDPNLYLETLCKTFSLNKEEMPNNTNLIPFLFEPYFDPSIILTSKSLALGNILASTLGAYVATFEEIFMDNFRYMGIFFSFIFSLLKLENPSKSSITHFQKEGYMDEFFNIFMQGLEGHLKIKEKKEEIIFDLTYFTTVDNDIDRTIMTLNIIEMTRGKSDKTHLIALVTKQNLSLMREHYEYSYKKVKDGYYYLNKEYILQCCKTLYNNFKNELFQDISFEDFLKKDNTC